MLFNKSFPRFIFFYSIFVYHFIVYQSKTLLYEDNANNITI